MFVAYFVRQMTQADWPAVSSIYQQGMDTLGATFQALCPPWEEWDASHLQACRLVIEDANEVVGFAALTAVSSRCVYAGVAEVSIYVAETQRGRGAGKHLLAELIRCSEQYGMWMLQSNILQENTASIRLHESCGFRMVGYREKLGRDRYGVWRNTVLMEKRSARDDLDCECSCSGDRVS